MKNHKFWKTNW